jgi:hypothetical protein
LSEWKFELCYSLLFLACFSHSRFLLDTICITLQIVKDKEIYRQNGIEAIDSVFLGSDLHDSCVSTELRLLLLCATGILAPFYYLLPSATFKFYLANDFHGRQEKNRERMHDCSTFRSFLALF